MAWANVAASKAPWAPVIRNSSFDWGLSSQNGATTTYRYLVPFWEVVPASGYTWLLNSADAHSGSQCLELSKTTAPGSITTQAYQYANIPVSPGQLVKLQGWVKQMQTTATGVSLFCEWADPTGVVIGTTTAVVASSISNSIDAVWRQVTDYQTVSTNTNSLVVTVPTGAASLHRFGINVSGTGSLTVGSAFRFDDLQCWIESNSPLLTQQSDSRQVAYGSAYPLVLEDATASALVNEIAAIAHFNSTQPNSTEGSVVLERRDQNAAMAPPALNLLGRLIVGSGLLSNGATPGALSPRISVQGDITTLTSATKTLILESDISGSSPSQRIYANGEGALEFTLNARYDGANWNKDVIGQSASRITFDNDAFTVDHQYAAFGTSWAESAWTISPMVFNLEAGNTFRINAVDTNSTAVAGIGAGTGAGLTGTGGSSNGPGLLANGGATNGNGIVANGTGTGDAIQATANGAGSRGLYANAANGVGVYASGGTGVWGYGGTGAGTGVNGQGGDTSGPGMTGTGGSGGAGTAIGVVGAGVGAGVGVKGTGGNTNAAGVQGIGHGTAAGLLGTGGATNGPGASGQGTALGAGLTGTGGATGSGGNGMPMSGNTSAGVVGIGGSGGGDGGDFTGILGGNGITAVGGTASGIGVQGWAGTGSAAVGGDFNGDSGGAGMSATGGATGGPGINVFGGQTSGSGSGVVATGGHPDGVGVAATSHGNGDAITGTAPGGGNGITATSVNGQGGNFFSTNAVGLEVATTGATAACLYVLPSATAVGINVSTGGTGSPLRLGSVSGFPTTHLAESDVCYNSSINTLNCYDGSYWTSNYVSVTFNPAPSTGTWSDNFANFGCARDSTGRVVLRGAVKTTVNTDMNSSSTNTIFQLPSGFRPTSNLYFTVTFPNAFPAGPGEVSSDHTTSFFLEVASTGNVAVNAYALNNGNTLLSTVIIPFWNISFPTW